MICYSFFKNWFHVSTVIFYGSYSYFSAKSIFDIYLYELFNTCLTTLPIIIYTVFDEQFNYEESMCYSADLYKAGPKKEYFNQIKYFKSIGLSVIYGFISLVTVFMYLEEDMIDRDGLMGCLQQSGAVLYFNVVLVANLRVCVLSSGITLGLVLAVFISIFLYWACYFGESLIF